MVRALTIVGQVFGFFLPLIANGVMLYALIKYRKFRHDRILLFTLLLFGLHALMRFLINILNTLGFWERLTILRVVTSLATPFLYALALCLVYTFIFQLERFRSLIGKINCET